MSYLALSGSFGYLCMGLRLLLMFYSFSAGIDFSVERVNVLRMRHVQLTCKYFKPELTIVILIHYKPRIAGAIPDL